MTAIGDWRSRTCCVHCGHSLSDTVPVDSADRSGPVLCGRCEILMVFTDDGRLVVPPPQQLLEMMRQPGVRALICRMRAAKLASALVGEND
jgi:hypothetical protein